eukprot:78783-Rhodomonas_salina.2
MLYLKESVGLASVRFARSRSKPAAAALLLCDEKAQAHKFLLTTAFSDQINLDWCSASPDICTKLRPGSVTEGL